MSLLNPTRRWRPTETDFAVLAVGGGCVVAGLVVTWKLTDTVLWLFVANVLLSVGVAIALVGVVLRMQLDLQDELDEAQRARGRFEAEMRRDIALIDRRVTEALSRLPQESDMARAEATLRTEELMRQLEAARLQVQELEEELQRSGRRSKPESLLKPTAPPNRGSSAEKSMDDPGPGGFASRSIQLLRHVRPTLEFVATCALAGLIFIGGFKLVLLTVPGARDPVASSGSWKATPWGWEGLAVVLAIALALVATSSWPKRIALFVACIACMNAIAALGNALHSIL